MTQIGESAFYECRAAASIHVPGSVKEIRKFAFAYCEKAADIQIDEGVEVIGDTAFQSCGCEELTLPGSVKTIGERAFGHSKNLWKLTIPDSVTQIGPYAFTWCSRLCEITIGTGVTSIGKKAFGVSDEMKFRLYSENDVVWAYDWTGDKRVVAYMVTFRHFDDDWSFSYYIPKGEKQLDWGPNVWDYSTDEEVLTFAGWEPELTEDSAVTGDAEYVAVFTSEPRKYQVVFLNYDGSVLKEIFVAAGETLADRAPAASRAGEGHTTYTFAGWQPALDKNAPILGDITYKALYTRKTQTGSRLQELDVFFTRNRMGEDGQVKSGIVDRTGKVRRYTFADGASCVTIRQGDNAIRVTEKETGKKKEPVAEKEKAQETEAEAGSLQA